MAIAAFTARGDRPLPATRCLHQTARSRLDSSQSLEAAALPSQLHDDGGSIGCVEPQSKTDVGIGAAVGYEMPAQLWRPSMARGTVKWFNSQKGYGFIQPQDGGRDVFVHISAVERAGLPSLNEGQTVEFELVSNRGKTSAENLKVSR
jgi:CspA family cold shock protein